MKNSFNYSGFCKNTYTFNSKKAGRIVVGDKSSTEVDSASRVPPYLAQTAAPAPRFLKGRW